MERELRKARSNLTMSGRMVILFSVWGLLKTASQVFYGKDFAEFRSTYAAGDTLFRVVLIIEIVIFLILVADIYLYVGLKAIGEGEGKRKRSFYLFVAAFLFLAYFSFVVGRVYLWIKSPTDVAYIVSALVDVTFCVAIFDIIRSALIIRRAERIAKEE